jgi:alkanesulfonate monooxygenase SsuD/methylene tetrahydromethanopterin reductase-like flavin-dependent oxidoreductase (luciferase family)
LYFRPGASDDGKKLAAKHADAIFTHHDTLDEGKAFYRDVKQSAGNKRSSSDLHIFQGVSVIVGKMLMTWKAISNHRGTGVC